MRVTIELADDEVLVALKRPEGYEDVHPELVAEDAIRDNWPDSSVVWPLEWPEEATAPTHAKPNPTKPL